MTRRTYDALWQTIPVLVETRCTVQDDAYTTCLEQVGISRNSQALLFSIERVSGSVVLDKLATDDVFCTEVVHPAAHVLSVGRESCHISSQESE